jgi:hypothetical protein
VRLFDSVILLKDLPEEGLYAGVIGAIVEIYHTPPGYEVEFFDSDWQTIAVLGVSPEFVGPYEVAKGLEGS